MVAALVAHATHALLLINGRCRAFAAAGERARIVIGGLQSSLTRFFISCAYVIFAGVRPAVEPWRLEAG
jgi:hypothetical protein